MDCQALKNKLLTERPEASTEDEPEVRAHLAGCRRCSAFARRLALARGVLRGPGCEVLPDGGFAARVLARLSQRQPGGEMLAWAALRALPAAVLVAVVLVGMAAAETNPPADSLLVDVPSANQLLVWSAQDGDAR